MATLRLGMHAPVPYKVAGAHAVPQGDRLLLLGSSTVHTLTPEAGRSALPLPVPEFAPFEADIVSLAASANANFIVAIISSGCVLKWDARADQLAALPSLPAPSHSASQGTDWIGATCGISDDGNSIIVAASNRRLFIRDESFLRLHTDVSRLDGILRYFPAPSEKRNLTRTQTPCCRHHHGWRCAIVLLKTTRSLIQRFYLKWDMYCNVYHPPS